MRISDWSSDVCSSDLLDSRPLDPALASQASSRAPLVVRGTALHPRGQPCVNDKRRIMRPNAAMMRWTRAGRAHARRSEEHPPELKSIMRNSYAVFCLQKKTTNSTKHIYTDRIIKNK